MSDSAPTEPTPTPAAPAAEQPKRYLTPPTDAPANNFAREGQVGLDDAVKTITLDDFKKVHLQPCFREANLYGMGAGFGVGGLRFVFGGNVARSCNWAVGGFILTTIGCYERCQYQRRKEKDGMRRAAEIIEKKRIEREAKIAEIRARKAAGLSGSSAVPEHTQVTVQPEGMEKIQGSQRAWYKFW
ncbi:hypothetical protein FPQ18DRAFT_40070 [Pyronema domesticum]|uniref:Cytochrome c oxidase assembly protein COX20, mitochondrial n=1 Tax=Pyronema omphalodes (strain CBS 100304) TaxID=1076935 RepID=U4LU05_PYROM|nr:hypothetical protein FPQ18DRAFT_40070 [Pyronema domesticum]CCX33270.1 Similar to Cytochrome c oxidase protein 20, mitochondrial; acc. no. Q75D23 [Pyronema omphalodes CBS 100304]